MRTLLLTRSETEVLLEPAELLADLRAAFRAYSLDRGVRAQRVRSALPGPGTATVLFPGIAADIPAYTVKVHAKFPEQQPAIRGVLCLCDSQTGELLAVMDSTHLTAVRTGLCSALATDVLARRDARSVAVIGAGVHPGRVNAEQITLYGGVGLAFQDVVAAWQIYQAARARGAGREINFLA